MSEKTVQHPFYYRHSRGLDVEFVGVGEKEALQHIFDIFPVQQFLQEIIILRIQALAGARYIKEFLVVGQHSAVYQRRGEIFYSVSLVKGYGYCSAHRLGAG